MMNIDPEDRDVIRAGAWALFATAATLGGVAGAATYADSLLLALARRWPELAEPPVEPTADVERLDCQRERGCVFEPGHVGDCRDRHGTDLTIPF